MAIVVRTAIEGVDKEAHDRLERAIEAGIERQGGPPQGLMVHLGHPSAQDLVLLDVWTSESVFRAWWSDVMEPALAAEGLIAGEHKIDAVWSLARP